MPDTTGQLFVGLMSGTSLDGVDAALVDFSGPHPLVRATHFAPFPPDLRSELLALQTAGPNEIERAALAANGLARAYAAGVDAVLKAARVPAADVCAVGAHGQTVRHRPELGFTVQLNSPALLAELTSTSVVADFRSRDVAAGGQGPELVRLKSAELIDSAVSGEIVRVSVRFEAELAEGEAGIRETRERWTFERPLRSRDPNWQLAGVAQA
jgi:1,6-anhydro-N-acetylmuramate kinase